MTFGWPLYYEVGKDCSMGKKHVSKLLRGEKKQTEMIAVLGNFSTNASAFYSLSVSFLVSPHMLFPLVCDKADLNSKSFCLLNQMYKSFHSAPPCH